MPARILGLFNPAKSRRTAEAFASFLFWLSPDPTHAAKKSLDLRQEIVKLFIRRGCAHEDELADRTLDRVATIAHLEPGKYPSAIDYSMGAKKTAAREILLPCQLVVQESCGAVLKPSAK